MKQLGIEIAYDIKIISENEEYKPTNFNENVEVTIDGIKNNSKEQYKLIHIKEDKITEEIKDIQIKENKLNFNVQELNTYVLLDYSQQQIKNEEQNGEPKALFLNNNIKALKAEPAWDGKTIAQKFEYGEGTEEKPYLILNGKELAYLCQQVGTGTTYEGTYFQLAKDIDLGNNEWAPIGDVNNPFQGIFDGAGYTIANANIVINVLPIFEYPSYGLFGSIGGGNSKAIVRNLELSKINIQITKQGTTMANRKAGLHIGTLVGTIYKNANIANVIIKDSSITDTQKVNIYDGKYHLSVGGVAGYVGNMPGNDNNPGEDAKSLIENCFSNTTIDLDAEGQVAKNYFTSRNGRAHYHTGGIVGTISHQSNWPKNCLYMGNIKSNGFIGPIFAGVIGNTDYLKENNFATIWNGNDAGGNLTTDNLYYSNCSIAGRNFTETVNSGTSNVRISNTSTEIGYVQGINKGTYTTDLVQVLDAFNSKANSNNKYLNWIYENNTFTFQKDLTTRIEKTGLYTYEVIPTDTNQSSNYTNTWYKDGIKDDTIIGSKYEYKLNFDKDENIRVITSNGKYYSIAEIVIKKIEIRIDFDVDEVNNKATAILKGTGLEYTTLADYQLQWYKEDTDGERILIEGANQLTITKMEDSVRYVLVATNTKIPQLSVENGFVYGNRIVIYVDFNNGNDKNSGTTDQDPVETLKAAYSKIDPNGNRNKNFIVIMGTYNSNNFMKLADLEQYNKNATITGKYGEKDYNGELYFYGRNTLFNESDLNRYMAADTTFQNLTFNGNGNEVYLYLQGNNLTIGENVIMKGYAKASDKQGLLGNNAPAFHVICGWQKYNYKTLPKNNSKVLIKSGTYARIIGGGSPGLAKKENLEQEISHNFMGSSMEDSFHVEITIDIKHSTTPSEYDYDVNLLVGGSACGNNYSVVKENIKSGSIGRVLGGSIRRLSRKTRQVELPYKYLFRRN